MNLITSKWISFIDSEGRTVKGTPSAIAFPHIVDIEYHREEMRAGVYQFLIGLLHTAFQPKSTSQWADFYVAPPKPAPLHRAFLTFEESFHFSGEGVRGRFMQEYHGFTSPTSIRSMIIGAPGESTSKKNLDLFTKTSQITGACEDCAAAAIHTFSCAGISNGGGHREGLRKPNHMTTLLIPNHKGASLWEKLWVNVIDGEEMPAGSVGAADKQLFPWLGPTKTSEGRQVVTRGTMHPLHVFWPMASRFYIDDLREKGQCDICGETTNTIIRTIHRKRHGMNYDGQWTHPLTPYSSGKNAKGVHLPAYPPASDFTYGDWIKTIASGEGEKDLAVSAQNVTSYSRKFKACKDAGIELPHTLSLWYTGFNVDSAKIVSWTSTMTPYFAATPSVRGRLLRMLNDLHALLLTAIKEVRKSGDIYEWNQGSNKARQVQIKPRLYEMTEPTFYGLLPTVLRFAELGSSYMGPDVAREWYQVVVTAALKVFDDIHLASPDPGALLKTVEKRKALVASLDKKMESFRAHFEGEAS